MHGRMPYNLCRHAMRTVHGAVGAALAIPVGAVQFNFNFNLILINFCCILKNVIISTVYLLKTKDIIQ